MTDLHWMSSIPCMFICFKETCIILVPKKYQVTWFNDYCLVALTSTIIKYFKRFVMAHICVSLPDNLDPMQFACKKKRFMENVLSLVQYRALDHLDNKNICIRMLFIDYSLTFKTIKPNKFIFKVLDLGLEASIYKWLLTF